MSVSPSVLPALPGMLARAVPTVARARKTLDRDPENIHARFTTEPVNNAHLQAYRQQFGGFISAVPLTYFYLVAQRAHLAVMLKDTFPWPVLGMVHVANKMEWLAEFHQDLPLELDVTIEIPARAATRKRVRPIYKVSFAQQGNVFLQCVSTYQTESKKDKKPKQRTRSLPVPDFTALTASAHWDLSSATGRSYARLSGDYNPIHLHSWLSRWFGFERPIIHGMYSVARAQADIERQSGRSVQMMDIGFRRPLVLPAEAICWHSDVSSQANGILVVSNARKEKSFLEGEFRL